ncbi:MAG: hypothetical protein ABIV43_00285 [Candidatus Saccharimonadales bacterium]
MKTTNTSYEANTRPDLQIVHNIDPNDLQKLWLAINVPQAEQPSDVVPDDLRGVHYALQNLQKFRDGETSSYQHAIVQDSDPMFLRGLVALEFAKAGDITGFVNPRALGIVAIFSGLRQADGRQFGLSRTPAAHAKSVLIYEATPIS